MDLRCGLVEERVRPNGALIRRSQRMNATLELRSDNTSLVVTHKQGEYTLSVDESLVVHRRFVKEGKATLCFKKQGVHLLLSDAPTKPLSYFIAQLIPNCSDSASDGGRSDGRSDDARSRSSKENTAPSNISAKPTFKRPLSSGSNLPATKRHNNAQPTVKADVSRAPNKTSPAVSTASMLSPESLNTQQKHVLKLVAKGQSVFFTGSAGTGKSFLLRHILAFLPRDSTFVTATTGLAASLIGGTTVHSFAGFVSHKTLSETELASFLKSAAAEFWRQCTTLIIDEISMLDGRYFEKMEMVARAVKRSKDPFGGIQLVICGDFFQLPPVNSGEADAQTVLCFQATAWQRCIRNTIVLERVHRQTDTGFVKMLNDIREGRCPAETVSLLQGLANQEIVRDGIEATILHSHNDAVESINSMRLRNLPSDSIYFDARDSTDSTAIRDQLDRVCPVRRRIEYKAQAQVILVKNLDVNRGLVNGARGVIVRFTDVGLPVVQFRSGVEQVIGREKFVLKSGNEEIASRSQIPLNLAWALSIHKSQGMTLDCVEVSLGKIFASGQAYVALSRARSASCLRVLDLPADPKRVIHANPFVVSYYRMLQQQQRRQLIDDVLPLILPDND